jgi:hypothetical protein
VSYRKTLDLIKITKLMDSRVDVMMLAVTLPAESGLIHLANQGARYLAP